MMCINFEPLIGAHMSIVGGVHNAIKRGKSVGCKTIQIFVKNNNRWNSPPLTELESVKFKELVEETNISPIIAHSSYLINMAAQDKKILVRSHYALIDELERCGMLDIKLLVIHPGYHNGAGINEGINRISETIDIVYEKIGNIDVKIVLETTAGQGTSVGSSFDDIKEIISKTSNNDKISVCLDTAHIFEAGYNIRTVSGYEQTIKKFDEIIGLNRLSVIHINDSKTPLNSKVDRHEHIGKGMIGIDTFRFIMNDKRLSNIPKILETPKGVDLNEDIENLKILKNLIKN